MDLVIATHNPTKYESLANLIRHISDDKLLRVTKLDSNIQSPVESGATAYENCLLKIKYYRKYISSPFIVIDDELKFAGDAGAMSFGAKFHRLGTSKEFSPIEIFKFLQNKLVDPKSLIHMKRIRHIGLVVGSNSEVVKFTLNADLSPLAQNDYNKILELGIQDNPLNYFAVPKGEKKRIWEYNPIDRISFVYNKNSQAKIKRFIQKIKTKISYI